MYPRAALVHLGSLFLSRGHGTIEILVDEACCELNAMVSGTRLRDIALIGELLILQGI